ncbi:MAG: hypothetical protein AVO35_11340 [Candidatus Aegiribacteria sp. MLS_C]|nr:MAG: hypothetical protein AVO35_11340 [Candidatus Aegiribacteria sp. MLS_C]
MEEILYRELRDLDIDGVTRMWRESLDGWPPGFFGGSGITAETVRREERSSNKLFTILALFGDRVVGYCLVSPYGGEPDASYVNLVNVVPDMHGRGIGKALLLDAVARSSELGLYRIDLHTWPANMKAVPLYKKTGFFWVPDTSVYMQNYMPFLLGMNEFRDFLEGEDWYSCLRRELTEEQDRQRTDSGRDVFTYWFRMGDREFLAEFDRSGRILSRLEYPGLRACIEVDDGRDYFVGRQYTVEISGHGFDTAGVEVEYSHSIRCSGIRDGRLNMEPLAVRVEKSPYEIADRLRVELPDGLPALGLGVCGSEEVRLASPPFLYLAPGSSEVSFELRKLSGRTSVILSWSVEGRSGQHELDLSADTYQSFTLQLPELCRGVHLMTLRLGESSHSETVVLIVGSHTGPPETVDTRGSALVLGGDMVLSFNRKGGRTSVWVPGAGGKPERLGSFFICAGPPVSWNSDLPRQTYELELGEGQVTGSASWPSRPGMTHFVNVRLDREGFIETCSRVHNGSTEPRTAMFSADSGWAECFEPRTDLLPMPDGLMAEQRVYNQVPDWAEDLTSSTSGLAAPWTGVTGGCGSAMNYFPGWTELEHDMPGTGQETIPQGGSLVSPPFMILFSKGGVKHLLARAGNLGWKTGGWDRRIPFFRHDLEPVMGSGAEFTLGHPLHGGRTGSLEIDGERKAGGEVRTGHGLSAKLEGKGRVRVGLSLAGRSMEYPVFLVQKNSSVDRAGEPPGELLLTNDRVRAVIDPRACGQVHSLEMDGTEYLFSSHPVPSEFCWEKPWFGGIVPRVSGTRGHPYPLQDSVPLVEEYTREHAGLSERGWRMSWRIDRRHYGSLSLTWTVSLFPSVPLLRTLLELDATAGAFHPGELDFRGFLAPGGSRDGALLTCDSFPALVQGRDHAGAWTDMGKWARVARGNAFVEGYSLGEGVFFCEDYGRHGCHLSVIGTHDRPRRMEMLWLFGSVREDDDLARIVRAHR